MRAFEILRRRMLSIILEYIACNGRVKRLINACHGFLEAENGAGLYLTEWDKQLDSDLHKYPEAKLRGKLWTANNK